MLTSTGIKWTINSLYSSYLIICLQLGLGYLSQLCGWVGAGGIWSSGEYFLPFESAQTCQGHVKVKCAPGPMTCGLRPVCPHSS